jgi:hypothetical protein
MMETSRRVFFVRQDESQSKWLVGESGEDGTCDEFSTHEEAVEAAKKLAQAFGPSRLLVHNADGTLDYEAVYEEDPLVTQLSKFGF